MEKNRADVIICGTNYVLSSDKSEERIKDIAKMVDEELRAVSKALNVNPNYKAAVLTALNIAEKLMDNTDMTLKTDTEHRRPEKASGEACGDGERLLRPPDGECQSQERA